MTRITVPLLVSGYQHKKDQVSGMVVEEDHLLIIKLNPALTDEEIGKIFGRIEYKVLLSSFNDGVETINKLHVVSWRSIK